MVEGISMVRYVIAVSRLIPHGAFLVPTWWQFTSAAAVSFGFLFLVLWNQTRAAGSHINQRRYSRCSSGSMGRKREVAASWRAGITEKMRWGAELKQRRDDVRWVKSGVVYTPGNEVCCCPPSHPPSRQCHSCSAESQTTAPGEVWHHRLLLYSCLETVIFPFSGENMYNRCLRLTLLSCIFCLLNHA